MLQVKCGSCGHLGDIEDFESVLCNGPADYQCPKCSAFYQRKICKSEKDYYTSVELLKLIYRGFAKFTGKFESDKFIDKYFLYGERYIRVRNELKHRTIQCRLLNLQESYKVTLDLRMLNN